MKRMSKSELIYIIFAYVFVGIFAILAVYPFVYTVSASMSGKYAFNRGDVVLFPKEIQFAAYARVFNDKTFWISYTNTLFYTFYGTVVAMIISITGAYALAKKRLLFRRPLNFLLVFTMWFSAGLIPTYINYVNMNVNNRWGIIFAFGVQAFNIILLRNYFESIPSEIEEAAVSDGATEFKLLTKIYVPMSKAAIATVTLFTALARWNGYFWTRQLLSDTNDQPLQVYIRIKMENILQIENEIGGIKNAPYSYEAIIYSMLVCSIIPIILVYPYLQKYFVKGVNVGGVKG